MLSVILASSSLKRVSAISLLGLTLAACSGGSGGGGSDVAVDNNGTSGGGNYVYSGPTPASPEIQSFKVAFYDNLVDSQRCGECHTPGGAGTTFFVNRDDVNLAWQAANTVVNLADPTASAVVQRVANGHNCWLGAGQEATCATTITGYIERWAQGTSASVSSVTLLPRNPVDTRDYQQAPIDLAAVALLNPTLDLTAAGELLDILRDVNVGNCSNCHSETATIPQSPFFASSNDGTAYAALIGGGKINLETPASSRLVLRLRQDFHNCWSDCAANATTVEDAIERFSAIVPVVSVDPSLLVSKSQGLERDGIVATAGGRYESDVIAKWEFREGTGMSVADTSGVQPEIPLTLSGGYEWLGGWGVRFTGGKAQGGTGTSQKLKDLITGTGEYSIEAWVAPNNVTQEDAWIVGYSGGEVSRNMLFTQTMYNYDSYTRSSVSIGDGTGGAALSTDDADELVQATLQHVVITFDPISGRKIYVNGVDSGVVDPLGAGLLTSWNDSYALTLGNSVSFNNDWLGAVRMVAIHNRALTPAQVSQNLDVGIGQKYYLLFSVSDTVASADCLVNTVDGPTHYCYVGFEVSEYDDTSYLFNQPFFVNLNPNPTSLSFTLQGVSLGLNGRLVPVGQGFLNINTTVETPNFTELGQQLSSIGTIITKENGPAIDEFFLAFKSLDGQSDSVPASSTSYTYTVNLTGNDDVSDLAFRTFDAVNQTFSQITGVSSANATPSAVTGKTVPQVYDALRQQLPSVADFQTYFSSHQMAITQLASAYCDALVQDAGLRNTMFPSFTFGSNVSVIDGTNFGNNVVDPLLDEALNTGLFGSGLALAARADTRSALIDLYADTNDNKPYVFDGTNYIPTGDGKRDGLRYCDNAPADGVEDACPAGRTSEVVKAACTAVLASGAVQIN